jgi:putative transposase
LPADQRKFADKWHLDEMVVAIKGRKYWLWRAVDADGYSLDAFDSDPPEQAGGLEADAKAPEGPMRHTACHDHR